VRLPSGASILRDCLLVLSPRHHFDVQSWRDPWPGLVDLARVARRHGGRVVALVHQRFRRRAELRSARSATAWSSGADTGGRILFLCHGNINRSALAQAYAQQKYGGRAEFMSAGFHQPDGRPADPNMVDVARGHGIELGEWASRTLTPELAEHADVILAMEVAHLDRLAREFPAHRHKAWLLGARGARAASEVEVADPYGLPREVYARVCRQVLGAVDAWFGQGCSPGCQGVRP
jgi:protein-tyrosine-phosphatase